MPDPKTLLAEANRRIGHLEAAGMSVPPTLRHTRDLMELACIGQAHLDSLQRPPQITIAVEIEIEITI